MWGDRLPRSQDSLLIPPPVPLPIKTVKRKVAKVSNKQKINVERFSVKNSRSLSQFGQWLPLSLSLLFSLCVCVGWLPVWGAWQQALTLWQQHTLPAFQMKNDSAWLESRRIASHRVDLSWLWCRRIKVMAKGGTPKMWIQPGEATTTLHRRGTCGAWFFLLAVAVCLSSEKCRAASFCIFRVAFASHVSIDSFIHPPLHSVIHSLIHSFLHSLTHSFTQSSVLFGFAPSIPLWLRLLPFSLRFLARFLFHFHFHFDEGDMRPNFGSFIKFSKSHLALSRPCIVPCSTHTHTHTHTVPIPQGKNVSKKAF